MDIPYEQARLARISAAVGELEARLSPRALLAFKTFAWSTKPHMKLIPLPDMQQHVASWMDRLFAPLGPLVVHAQGMYYGSTYLDATADGTTMYATGITDTSAACSCHQSYVTTTITFPDGGWTDASDPQGGTSAYSEADLWYTLEDADYDVGGDITVSSLHNSWCPVGDVWFIENAALSFRPFGIAISVFTDVTSTWYGCWYSSLACARGTATCSSGWALPLNPFPCPAYARAGFLVTHPFGATICSLGISGSADGPGFCN
jgi:hypothetical protein